MSKPEAEEKDFSGNEGNCTDDNCGDTEKDIQVHKVVDEEDGERSLSGDGPGADRVVAGEEIATEKDAGEEEGGGELEKELDAARVEAQENYDRFLRATVELDNYRKRTAKVRSETREETFLSSSVPQQRRVHLGDLLGRVVGVEPDQAIAVRFDLFI